MPRPFIAIKKLFIIFLYSSFGESNRLQKGEGQAWPDPPPLIAVLDGCEQHRERLRYAVRIAAL
jgi:hypothetical protein